MLKYIIKRLLIFIPTLIAISLLAFVISINSPADPVEMLSRAASSEGNLDTKSSAENKVKNEIRKRLGLDLPVFYVSLNTLADCDTLIKISDKNIRNNLHALTRLYGNWENVQEYYQSINNFVIDVKSVNSNEQNKSALDQAVFSSLTLKEIHDDEIITSVLDKIKSDLNSVDSVTANTVEVNQSFITLQNNYTNLKEHTQIWKTYIPSIWWSGFDNQYHLWLFGDIGVSEPRGRKGVIRGDFGESFSDNQPIVDKIIDKFMYSFILVFLSIIIAYLISIPLGIYAAYYRDGKFDSTSSIIVFMLYSLPSYFVGTLLLYAFANPDNLVWFPVGGVMDPLVFDENWNLLERIQHQSPYFVLPLISFTYSSFAFISRIMRVSMIDVLGQDYIRTARAKGLSEKRVVLVHALRNALLPIVTMLADIFPAALGGSVILETIFSIPGMGLEIYNSVMATDIPMIVAIFTLTGLLTVIGYLVADILYAIVDPRISYKD